MTTLMTEFAAAALIERLGWTLFHFVWQALLVTLVVAVALRIFRGAAANQRYACKRTSWPASALLGLLLALGFLVARSSALQNNNQDPSPQQLAQQVADLQPLGDWKLQHVDDQPSIHVDGFDGYRMVLRKGWPVADPTLVQQQKAGPPLATKRIDDDWEFVLIPTKPQQPPRQLKSKIPWRPSKCPYHTQDICLGEGHGYVWYTRGTLFFQHHVGQQLKLTGGDDPIQVLVDGLLIDDDGTMTANSVTHLIAAYGDRALTYLEAAIKQAQQTGREPWRAIQCLTPINTDRATGLLLRLFNSDNKKNRQAAMYALIHEPFRPAAKAAYLEILRERRYLPRMCRASLQFEWQEALPILQAIVDQPNNIFEYRDAVRGLRALAGHPISPELLSAEQSLRGLMRRERDDNVDAELRTARRLLIDSDDAEGANLSALMLAVFTTKGSGEPVRAAGIDILRARPKTSTIDFLRSLKQRLPDQQQTQVNELLTLISGGNVQHSVDDSATKIAWGTPVRGLRAGIAHSHVPGLDAADQIRIGGKVAAQVVIENVSDAAISFSTIAPGSQTPTIRDADGQPVMLAIPPYNGPALSKSYRVNPGNSVRIPLHTCSVAPRPMFDNLYGYHIHAGLGRYRLTATLTFGGFDGQGWNGKLTTGPLEFQVVPTDQQELTERMAQALNERATSLSCKVVYLGPPEMPRRSVGLMAASFTEEYPPPWTLVNIDEQAAQAIIDFLAAEGHLYRYATDPNFPSEFPQVCYFLAIDTVPKRPGSIAIPLSWSSMHGQLNKLRDAVGGTGAITMDQILEQSWLTDWHHVTSGSLVAISVERQLYERQDSPLFYLRFRLTNRTKADVFVDLSDGNCVFFPNQWGFQRQPQRILIDEERRTPVTFNEPQTKDFIVRAASGMLTRIAAGQTIDYFRAFNASGRADVEAQQTDNQYLIISIDGQLRATDGEVVENITAEWDRTGSFSSQETDMVVSTPVSFAALPDNALIVAAE